MDRYTQRQYTHPNFNTPSQLAVAVEKGNPIEEYHEQLQDYTRANAPAAVAAGMPLQRLPTLHDVIQRKTQSPLDLWAFYVYMRDQHHSIDYLDFWLDAASHLNLCKHYVKGLGDGVLNNKASLQFLEREQLHIQQALCANDSGSFSSRDTPRASPTDYDLSGTRRSALQPLSEGSVDLEYLEKNGLGESGSFRALDPAGVRHSATTDDSPYRSVDSSILLELLKKGDIFEEDSNHRLSQFLRDGLYIDSPPEQERPLTNYYYRDSTASEDAEVLRDGTDHRHSSVPLLGENLSNRSFKRNSVGNDRTPVEHKRRSKASSRRISSLNPEMLERALAKTDDATTRLVTRDHLKESSRHILLTYFVDNAPKKLFLPEYITTEVVKAIEIEGRDDPEVFSLAKDWVFNAMQDDAFPGFLASCGICNITNKSYLVRIVLGMFLLFLTFWLGYAMIFLETKKHDRVPIFIPFFVSFYLILSALYYLCPVMVFCGLAESPALRWGIIRLKEPFIKTLLRKRSVFILCWMVFLTAAFSLVFILVPGARL
ncbi:hypothetical protein BABINDRAFT_159726 [Babjeviella inositovora NRRL Y-12698]|uniref:RGS domain-containing protein n=1 Tax=Babjeviella inositovora NRRL Y-12698 TaxID=984486 RepID=A0A1E3QWH8_9ASCO|nr:uncharacterized protein BABINDRAFT_159726 [Babjeviella inositovora NRRL Y-12698]ODQ81432.1 hypothetical protein BABINDRAFT_159726 [Babjeviella inositovora NRRL Y-12698]